MKRKHHLHHLREVLKTVYFVRAPRLNFLPRDHQILYQGRLSGGIQTIQWDGPPSTKPSKVHSQHSTVIVSIYESTIIAERGGETGNLTDFSI